MSRPRPWAPPDPLPGPLRTDRLEIRFHREADAPALYRAVDGHREALLPWLAWAREDHRRAEQSLERIRFFAASRAKGPPWANYAMGIFDPDSADVLGGAGFHAVEIERAKAEIGYWVRGDLQGRGIATEATRALVSAGFGAWGFRRIVIRCDRRNVGSARVVERVGLRLEGTAREARWLEGLGWGDRLTFALLASEWDGEMHRPRSSP